MTYLTAYLNGNIMLANLLTKYWADNSTPISLRSHTKAEPILCKYGTRRKFKHKPIIAPTIELTKILLSFFKGIKIWNTNICS